jgi:hypothetical protein
MKTTENAPVNKRFLSQVTTTLSTCILRQQQQWKQLKVTAMIHKGLDSHV